MKTYPVDFVPIKGAPMVRDMKSKAILNTDIDGLKAYKDRLKMDNDAQAAKIEINTIKEDLAQIKALLKELLK